MKYFSTAILISLLAVSPLTAHAQQTLSGSWTIAPSQDVDRVQLDVRTPDARGKYHDDDSAIVTLQDLHLSRAQLDSKTGQRAAFSLQRESGTAAFQGWLQNGGGGGTFTLTPDANYVRQLAQRGYSDVEPHRLLTATLTDLTLQKVDDFNRQGFGRLEFERLLAFGALHIDDAFIRDMRSHFSDVTAENIISLRALNVDAAYLAQLHATGLSPDTANEAIELKALHIDAAYVREMASVGYPHLAPRDLVQLRAMGIDAAYVRRVQAHGFHNLPLQKLVETKALGVI